MKSLNFLDSFQILKAGSDELSITVLSLATSDGNGREDEVFENI